MNQSLRLGSIVVLALVGACMGEAPQAQDVLDPQQFLPSKAAEPAVWRTAPSVGVALEPIEDGIRLRTGPHIVAWQRGHTPLQPPYALEAVFEKRAGRLYEGFGIVFGASDLDVPEDQQEYSYVLLRGDGAYLVKRRAGPEAPVVQGWTSHAEILRDQNGHGQRNHLRIEVDEYEVIIIVNGTRLIAIPADELRIVGRPGLRVAHDVELDVIGFEVRTGTGASEATP
jgi:hypothetical protein